MPSHELSTTRTWSTTPASRSPISVVTIGPIVAASSRAGRHTETLAFRSAARRRGENSPCVKLWLASQALVRSDIVPEDDSQASGGRDGEQSRRRREGRGREAPEGEGAGQSKPNEPPCTIRIGEELVAPCRLPAVPACGPADEQGFGPLRRGNVHTRICSRRRSGRLCGEPILSIKA